MSKFAKIKVAILCGGPSLERGISLNSARSVMDHLSDRSPEIVPIYFNVHKQAYKISKAQLYSNTPSDFDFKLSQTATALNNKELVKELQAVDIVFPVIHGKFGEDGGVQSFLEKNRIPFVGSSSLSCKKAFDKFRSNQILQKEGFFVLPCEQLKIYNKDNFAILEDFFKKYGLKKAIVKPANGGSSIGVFCVETAKQALEKVELLFSKRMDTKVVVEQMAEGREFTVIVLQNRFGLPVALPPTEIETDYTKNQIFDYRRKYLPTRQVRWHCPPRFNFKIINQIQAQAEQIFALFGLRDFARFDGWVLKDSSVWFCDLNMISGMEQNSFLFQQASRVGMTHQDILRYILCGALVGIGKTLPAVDKGKEKLDKRKVISILMGGNDSERQVSLMSGTNVWLKLRQSTKYLPKPYLLDTVGKVWELPYHLCLNHTVEEIAENCQQYEKAKQNLQDFEDRARLYLGLKAEKDIKDFFEPRKMTLRDFFGQSKFVFLALHGGDGENGVFQKMLTDSHIPFNGPDEKVSALCINKWKTSRFVEELKIKGISAINGRLLEVSNTKNWTIQELNLFWRKLKRELLADTIIIKPKGDGCTTGIIKLHTAKELGIYLEYIHKKLPQIPKFKFQGQSEVVEMPIDTPKELILEKFIETDRVMVKNHHLSVQPKNGWIEITVGVLEEDGKLLALNPSVTVVTGEVLTVEEKFQGGTGINITPPPKELMNNKILLKIKQKIEELANRMGIVGYSRIDAFVNCVSGEVKIIEINTLPGLTPSTVFWHQGLAEIPPIFPCSLLEKLIENKSKDDKFLKNVFKGDEK